jgi:hypothetical protein
MLDAQVGDPACKKFRWGARPLHLVELRSSAGARGRYCARRAPGAIMDDPVFAKPHMTAMRAYVLGAEEEQSDACEDKVDARFEFLTMELANARRPDSTTMGGSVGDVAAGSTGRCVGPRLRGAGRASQPLVLGCGWPQFARLRLAVCACALADAVAAAGLVRRPRRLWVPALVAGGYDPGIAAVMARPPRRYCRLVANGCGYRTFFGRGTAGGLAPCGCIDHGAESLRQLAHRPCQT